MKAAGYPAFHYPGMPASGPTSPGPYDPGSILGNAYMTEPFNLGQIGNITQLSDLINSINRSAQTTALQARIPGEKGLEKTSSTNIASELGGNVPQDVVTQLAQRAAERGTATGIGSTSPNTNAALLRALGLTSLDMTKLGQQELTAAEGRNPAAPIYDPASQLLTPAQVSGMGLNAAGLNVDVLRTLLAQQGRGGYGAGPGGTSFNYSPPTTTTGTTPLTGGDVLFNQPSFADTGGGTATTSSIIGEPFSGNYFDYTPPPPNTTDIGTGDYYAETPVSMYG